MDTNKGRSEFHMKWSQLQTTVQHSDPANRLFVIVPFLSLPEEGSGSTRVDKQMMMGTGTHGPFLCLSSSPT